MRSNAKKMHDQIQCNRVSVKTQGTVKLVAIRRLHYTCCNCVCCIASRSKRSQVIGSTGLGGANSALGLLLPMSSSSAILHSISLKLQQTSRTAGIFLIDGRVSCKPRMEGGQYFSAEHQGIRTMSQGVSRQAVVKNTSRQ